MASAMSSASADGPGLAEDVHVELVELAAAALLRLFVAETLADLEPLERFGEMPLMLGDEARQRGGHLRAQRDVAPALVLEAEQLAGELATGFFQVEARCPRGSAIRIRHSHSGGPPSARSRTNNCGSRIHGE